MSNVRRRSQRSDSTRQLGEIEIDRSNQSVFVAGERVPLRPTEYRLLLELWSQRGRAVRWDRLHQRVCGPSSARRATTIQIHISRLRAKLGAALHLETVRGWGYRLRLPEPPRESSGES